MKEHEKGKACSTHWRARKVMGLQFHSERQKATNHFLKRGVDMRITIGKWIIEREWSD
jgi:hypothetical protein